jgi:hypothetical protein
MVGACGRGDARLSEERFGADLRFRVRVREEVVVPVWMLWCGAVRGEHSDSRVVEAPVGERGYAFAARSRAEVMQ